jgi:hypothetical protein
MIIHESLLHRMQFAVIGQPLNGDYFRTVSLSGQNSARFNGYTVHVHNTSTALASIATHVGTGEPEILSQKLNE